MAVATRTPVDTAVSVSPSALDVALKAVKPAVGSKSAVAALAGVLLTADEAGLHLSATNMEVSVRRRVLDSLVEHDLDVVVDAKLLGDAIKALAKCETVAIAHSHEDSEVILRGGKRIIRLRPLRREDFPAMPQAVNPAYRVLSADAADFKAIVSRSIPFASGDETRPILTGVCFERDNAIVSTDSYRLTVLKAPFDITLPIRAGGPQPLNVPANALKMMLRNVKAGEVSLYSDPDRSHIGFLNMDACEEWSVRPILGQYPNYKQLIPDHHDVTVDMPTAHLLSASELAKQFCHRNAPMRMSVNGKVTVTGDTPDVASIEEIVDDATTTGTAGITMDIGFNPEFMVDIAKAVKGERCTLKLISPLRPGTVIDGEDRFLIMPIRLNV